VTEGLVARENRARAEAYRKDEVLERAVLEINEALAPHEPDVRDVPGRPHLFVFGLPRSGTTLLHQVLAWALDVGYVTNVMARFWLAPYAGAIVSRATVADARDGSFASDYGKSYGPAGGHEFAYFWQHWLGVRDVADLLDFGGDSKAADWDGAAAAVRRIAAAFDKPLLFKTNYAGQFLPAFARTFPLPLFVHVRRDPAQVALSILAARHSYYGSADTWWATYPPEYEQLARLPAAEQIAGQVVGLRRAYAAQIAKVPAELTVELDYEELCADPAAAVESIRERSHNVHGTAPARLHDLPANFERAPARAVATDEQRAVVEALTAALAQEPA
jgi:LPS sulfotransferase NodH